MTEYERTAEPPERPPRESEQSKSSDTTIARATVVIAVAAIFSLIVSGLQWCALRSTDSATHTAADAAKTSADLAVNVESPVILINQIAPLEALHESPKGMSTTFIAKFFNYGRTVAIAKEFSIQPYIGAAPSGEPKYSVVAYEDIIKASDVVPWQIPMRLAPLNLSTSDLFNIIIKKVPLWAYGYLKYADISSREHAWRFCLQWDSGSNLFVTSNNCPDQYKEHTHKP